MDDRSSWLSSAPGFTPYELEALLQSGPTYVGTAHDGSEGKTPQLQPARRTLSPGERVTAAGKLAFSLTTAGWLSVGELLWLSVTTGWDLSTPDLRRRRASQITRRGIGVFTSALDGRGRPSRWALRSLVADLFEEVAEEVRREGTTAPAGELQEVLVRIGERLGSRVTVADLPQERR